MFLEIVIFWPAIYGTLIGAILLSFLLFFIRKVRHRNILKKIDDGNYEEVILKLQKLMVRPFPVMLTFERELIYLEIAITSLLNSDYQNFDQNIQKVNIDKLNLIKQIWLALYSYQIKNYEDFEKFKSFAETIYLKGKSIGLPTKSYHLYREVLEELGKNYTELNKEALDQLMNKIKKGGNFLKIYIKQLFSEKK